MFSEIITTLESNIGSIQLNLFDFGVKKPKFEEILNTRFQNHETPQNVHKNLKLLANNHLEYINPICPNCYSKNAIKQEYQERHPIIDQSGSQTIYLRRYKCNHYGKKFVTRLDSVIKPHHRYANLFTEKIESFIQT